MRSFNKYFKTVNYVLPHGCGPPPQLGLQAGPEGHIRIQHRIPLRTAESPSTSLQKTPTYFIFLSFKKHTQKYIYFTGKKIIIPRFDRKVPGAFSFWAWRSHLSLMRPASGMLVRDRWASTVFHIWYTWEACWCACLIPLFLSRLCCHRTKSLRISSTIS